eukprot:scaffold242976_cov44-Attheya_sp.AAC.2
MKTGVAFMCAAAVAAMSGVEAFAPVPVQRNVAFASRSSGSALQAKDSRRGEGSVATRPDRASCNPAQFNSHNGESLLS